MPKKLFAFFSLLIVASMVLAACDGANNTVNNSADNTQNGIAASEPANEPAHEPVDEPAELISTRTGAWVDQVDMSLVSADASIAQLEADIIDIFSSALANPAQILAAQDAGMEMATTFGLYYELTLNPFEFTEGFNPFADGRIRQAMNWLIDRDYINQKIFGGLAIPKFFPLTTGFPDYAKVAEYAAALEIAYDYDFARAETQITEAMLDNGAERVDGKWILDGAPVELIFLIRKDSDGARVMIGDYIADQMESMGFTVDRQYTTASEAAKIWNSGNPHDGLWHMYTGSGSTSEIERDQGYLFMFFYTGELFPITFHTAFDENGGLYSQEFYDVAYALTYNTFTTPEERTELIGKGLELIFDLDQNYRIWLIDGQGAVPWSPEVSVAADLAGGVNINAMWPYTIKFNEQEGGLIRWGTPALFIQPNNPIGGSNWSYDFQWRNATQDAATFANPHTGVHLPQRIERAEVTIQDGLPVGKTYDWVDLQFASEILVPAGTWIDWDAETQTFIEADGTTTAKVKSVVYYSPDMFESHSWHDGSPLTVADFVMYMIMKFDHGKEASAIFDPAVQGGVEAYLPTFKGVAIRSTDPLVIEFYTDNWELDAEANVDAWWPGYSQGDGSWHVISLGNAAEAAGELAYTADKADANEIEWMNLVGGPSLKILTTHLATLAADSTIPYEPTLGAYITPQEAAARYANLQAFYAEHGHYWIGTGPFVLDKVDLDEKTLTLTRNELYPDLASKWDHFAAPKLSAVKVGGPSRVTIGGEVTFEIHITYEGEVYPGEEIDFVKYLLFDATDKIVKDGEATFIEDGYYEVTLDADATIVLEAGEGMIKIAVVAIPVAVPSFATFVFIAE